MSREEAIEVIKEYRDNLIISPSNQLDGDVKAFDMAIQALSQEPTFDDECQKDMDEAWEQIQKKRKRIPVTLDLTPCDDAISREAVLKLKHHKPEYGDMIYAFDVEQLPSVTHKSDNKYRKEAKRWKNKWLKSQKSAVLDKIRDEIVEEQSNWREDADAEWHECRRILRIIDKYRGDKNEI